MKRSARRPVTRAARLLGLALLVSAGCERADPDPRVPGSTTAEPVASAEAAFWNGSTIYFLLTDRFLNGDPDNDLALGRARDGATLRNFMGGDLRGVLRKLQEGYFDSLGVSAIWMTPFVEQIRGSVDEGTGKTYGFHGYWARDWTAVEPALGTEADLRALVDEAHRRGIRVLMDAVINHTGPVTPQDPQWPADWVRTGPRCVYRSYTTTVDCTLVENLPDILTNRDEPVELPPSLRDRWERDGRLEAELAELEEFFARTGHPRAPRYYLIKWLTDWVRELGIDGYRVDTAKHFEEDISVELKAEAERAFADWKASNPDLAPDDRPFFMMGEVYGYDVSHGRDFDFGDRTVDFYAHGYDGLINFGFKADAAGSLDEVYARYATALRGDLRGLAIVNYVSSHDDGSPYDPDRQDPLGAGTRLLLAPGGAQIYYGDEVARPLRVEGAEGDANLRSPMDWQALEPTAEPGSTAEPRSTRAREILEHWRKLGRFRKAHPAVGAGEHRRLRAEPYVFARTLELAGVSDRVVIAMDAGEGPKTIPVADVFPDGARLVDSYSGRSGTVANGEISLDTGYGLVLLGEPN